MGEWRELSADEVVARFGCHSMLAHELNPDGVVILIPGGWLVFHLNEEARQAGDEDGASAVICCQQSSQIAAALVHLEQAAQAGGTVLTGLSVPRSADFQPGEPWERHGGWIWYSTCELAEEIAREWDLIELDDVADAAEINAFGLRENPQFQGQAGRGLNRCWLGARDDIGELIGCGVIHQPGHVYGDLGGLVVRRDYRGRGLGRDLLVEMTRRVLDFQPVVTLSAWAESQAALRLYDQIGFIREHEFVLWHRN